MQGVKYVPPTTPSLEALEVELDKLAKHRYEITYGGLPAYVSAVALLDIAKSLRYIVGRFEEV